MKHSAILQWLIFLFLLFSSAHAGTNTTLDRRGFYSNYDPSMAIVIVVLVGVFFFITFFSVILRQCSEQNSIIVSANLRQKQGLDPAIRSSFPVFVYSEIKDKKIGRETLECAICLMEFEDDHSLKLLPKCSHVFHPECIDSWFMCHVTCPVCRAKQNSPVCQPVPVHVSEAHQNDVVISINDEPRREVSGRFPRSHSTGHSLARLGLSTERFTLRFPEELRRQIMESAKLKRTRSFDVIFVGEGSSSKGKFFFGWSDRLRSQPFGLRMGSGSGSSKYNKGTEAGDSVNGRSMLGNAKVPLTCFEISVEK